MLDKLQEIEARHEEINGLLSKPEIIRNRKEFLLLAREHAELDDLVKTYQQYKKLSRQLEEAHQITLEGDEELRELALEEVRALKKHIAAIEDQLKRLLLHSDPNDRRNIFLEVRAGTGGEEAALFAMDIFRMYTRYAERNKWRVEVMSEHASPVGGYKEIIALIEGEGAFSRLKYESGVHRVQRVPLTESQGRIHTSAVTVAILPEAEEIEVNTDPKDLKIDVYRSSGPGGQSVNTTDSAVRITHVPSGIVVTCQDEKSQHKNKNKAMRVLRARLLDRLQEDQTERISKTRKYQVGSGDRSERIRTYNFPQGRITDHRIGLTLYRLEQVLEGDMDEIIDALASHFESESLLADATHEGSPTERER
ncbi:MAG: peptide chain release factor 1 [Deltaproteobacteria bacterium]|nr:peptide chain release factor 1 [Deltaproteobacteria bacterium]